MGVVWVGLGFSSVINRFTGGAPICFWRLAAPRATANTTSDQHPASIPKTTTQKGRRVFAIETVKTGP
jgi:hypothetical protein